MTTNSITVEPIAGAVGAELHGVDLSRDLPDITIAGIRRALLDHGVIFFRDQNLDPEQHKALARRFGPIFVHPNFKGLGGDDEIVEIRRQPTDRKIVGEEWHCDTTMMAEPPLGAILYGIEVPPYGGDTMFASMYHAYDTLSDGMKRMLAGMRAVHTDHTVAGPAAARNAKRSTKVREDADWKPTVNLHPVVRAHPETGRKSLFVNRAYVHRFENMTEESARRYWTTCSVTGSAPNSPAASAGMPVRWRSGTIVARITSRSTMPANTFATFAACRSPVIGLPVNKGRLEGPAGSTQRRQRCRLPPVADYEVLVGRSPGSGRFVTIEPEIMAPRRA